MCEHYSNEIFPESKLENMIVRYFELSKILIPEWVFEDIKCGPFNVK